ncbi:putative pentatricopeptide repeat-containing protein At1g68930 isoform X2 [Zingiber officinale]|uniref:putative pentatricopeptide repeat-containing protein At1g68930 isoform X2 n=1 Tax=Zingiber officinale TaxID=94328 RepID=UPI001C4BF58A|nr:putative pentatricopeptide repeat-containing protein At1g68930 isoform X2 [Zingiber officinale]
MGSQEFRRQHMPSYMYLDEYSLSHSIKLLATTRSPQLFHSLHCFIIKLGFSSSVVLLTGLIDFAFKCGALGDSHKLFDDLPHRDVVAWTSMIVGHARHGSYDNSFSFFKKMLASCTSPNCYSFSGALTACSGVGVDALAYGKQIHAQVITSSFSGPINPVVYNGLLDMYCKCHCLSYARKLFGSMPVRGLIAWNSMMSGFLRSGQAEEALELLVFMVNYGVRPCDFTYAICIDACASLASINQGKQLHTLVVKNGFDSDLVIRNSLLDMYAKCGCNGSAKIIFEMLPSRDPILWTAMISTYGKSGCISDAIRIFEQMTELKIKHDEITYLAILSACSHAGLVNEGWHYFRLMSEEKHTVAARSEHYGCMVDLLCRSGRLEEALDFIKQMPFEPGISAWSALLSSCWIYGNTKLGEFAASQLLKMDPEFESNWVITGKIRGSMKDENVKKQPGCSWIELGDGVHVFHTADRSIPWLGEILSTLDTLKNDTIIPHFEWTGDYTRQIELFLG